MLWIIATRIKYYYCTRGTASAATPATPPPARTPAHNLCLLASVAFWRRCTVHGPSPCFLHIKKHLVSYTFILTGSLLNRWRILFFFYSNKKNMSNDSSLRSFTWLSNGCGVPPSGTGDRLYRRWCSGIAYSLIRNSFWTVCAITMNRIGN